MAEADLLYHSGESAKRKFVAGWTEARLLRNKAIR